MYKIGHPHTDEEYDTPRYLRNNVLHTVIFKCMTSLCHVIKHDISRKFAISLIALAKGGNPLLSHAGLLKKGIARTLCGHFFELFHYQNATSATSQFTCSLFRLF